MSTDIPTNPRAERHVIDRRAVAAALSAVEEESLSVEPGGFVLDEEHYLDLADAALAALDLPARDARIAAEAEERGWHRGFDHARRYPAAPAESSAVASSVRVEGSGHPQPSTEPHVAHNGCGHSVADHGKRGCTSSGCRCFATASTLRANALRRRRPISSLDTPEGVTDATH